MIPLPTLSLISSFPPLMLNALWLFAAVMVWPFRSMLRFLLLIERVPVNVILPLNWTFPPFLTASVSPVQSETGVAVPLEVPPVASDSVIASSPRVVPPPPYCCQSGCRHYADCHTDCQCHTNQSFFHLQKPPYKNTFCRSAPAGKPDASVAFLPTVGKSSAPL